MAALKITIHVPSVLPKGEWTSQEELPVVNWAQVNNKSPAALVPRGTLPPGKSLAELPKATLVRAPGIKIPPKCLGLPRPTRGAHTISSFASLLTNQNGWSQSSRTVLFGPNCTHLILHLHKDGPSGMGWGTLSVSQPPSVSVGNLGCSTPSCFTSELFSRNKVSLVPRPSWH